MIIYNDDLAQFVGDLRASVFQSQAQAGNYFRNINRTTLVRYELSENNFEAGGKNKATKARFDYIASLACLLVRRREADSEMSKEVLKKHLLNEINKVIKVNYPDQTLLTEWEDLEQIAIDYLQSTRVTTKVIDPPAQKDFHGRLEEISILEKELFSYRYRAIFILGMGGIGKSTLAWHIFEQTKTKILWDSKYDFEYFFWFSLRNTLSLHDLLLEWLKILLKSKQEEIFCLSTTELIDLFLSELQNHRCLFVLDNIESLLETQKNKYATEYEEYKNLFSIIVENNHKSFFILTGREAPPDILALEQTANPIMIMNLKGLSITDIKWIVREKKLQGTSSAWLKLIENYSGNPFALQIVTAIIAQEPYRNIDIFLANYPTLIFRDIFQLLETQYLKLSPLEQDIINWLAIEREAINLEHLQNNLIEYVPLSLLKETVHKLITHTLIEQTYEQKYTLQNLILEFVTSRFAEIVKEEVKSLNISYLHKYFLSKATAKNYIYQMQINLILTPIAKFLESYSLEILCQWFNEIISLYRHQKSYSPTNILGMAFLLKMPISSFDFSYSHIQEAFLQNAILWNTNFIGANFKNTVFRKVFDVTLSMAFHPNGKFLASGTTTWNIHLWDTETQQLIKNLEGHTNWIRQIIFTSDGKHLISGSDDAQIRIWDVQTGECIKILQGYSHIMSLAITADNEILVTGGAEKTIRFWHLKTGYCFNSLANYHEYIWSINFSPNGKYMVSSSAGDYLICLWDTTDILNPKLIQKFAEHTNYVSCVCFSPDGLSFASCSFDGTIRIWDLKTLSCVKVLEGHHNFIRQIAYHPKTLKLLSVSSDKTIKIWDTQTGDCSTLSNEEERLLSLAINPSGDMFAVGKHDEANILLWNYFQEKCIAQMTSYRKSLFWLNVSQDGNYLVTSGFDQQICIWDIYSLSDKPIKAFAQHVYGSAIFQNSDVVIITDHHNIYFWHWRKGVYFTKYSGSKATYAIISSEGTHLMATSWAEPTLQCWELSTWHKLNLTNDAIYYGAFHPMKNEVALVGETELIEIWDFKTEERKWVLEGHSGSIWHVSYSLNGDYFATASTDKTICLWKWNHTQQSYRLHYKIVAHTEEVKCVIFHPSGNFIASGSYDCNIALIAIATGEVIKILSGHESGILCLEFLPNGNTLVSCGHDGTVRFWDIKSGLEIKKLQAQRPYEGMNITRAKGLNPDQKNDLILLGAYEQFLPDN